MSLVHTDIDVPAIQIARHGAEHFIDQFVCFGLIDQQYIIAVNQIGMRRPL
ncbi:hypothetical protein D3C80_1834180 [compost metagenome]